MIMYPGENKSNELVSVSEVVETNERPRAIVSLGYACSNIFDCEVPGYYEPP